MNNALPLDSGSTVATDIRLSGRRSTPAHIARAVHRHLRRRGLIRVEVHYSTQISPTVTAQTIRAVLAPYMTQAVARRTPISIRRHDNPLDDATGEHLVRLIYTNGTHGEADGAPWWTRVPGIGPLLARLFGHRHDSAGATVSKATAPVARPRPAAVAALKLAIHRATAAAPTGDVTRAAVTVYDQATHLALQSMTGDAAAFTRWVAQQLRAERIATSVSFSAEYHHEPPTEDDATLMVLAGDIEVELDSKPQQASQASRMEPYVGASDETALPVAPAVRPDPAQRRCQVVIVAVGTTPLPRPIALDVAASTTLNRDFLASTPFGEAHPALLATLSRTVGLTVTPTPSGVCLAATAHPATGLAVYYLLNADGTTQPIIGKRTVQHLPARVYLNAPAGVASADGSRKLPPIVIELRECAVPKTELDPDATLLPGE